MIEFIQTPSSCWCGDSIRQIMNIAERIIFSVRGGSPKVSQAMTCHQGTEWTFSPPPRPPASLTTMSSVRNISVSLGALPTLGALVGQRSVDQGADSDQPFQSREAGTAFNTLSVNDWAAFPHAGSCVLQWGQAGRPGPRPRPRHIAVV